MAEASHPHDSAPADGLDEPRLIEDARYATLREFVSATAVADRVTVR